jgi:hypothetical protein
VRSDIPRMMSYRRCEQTYIYGPSGPSQPPKDAAKSN